MRHVYAVAAVLCMFSAGTSISYAQTYDPQRVRDVSVKTIERAIICEIGNFATFVKGEKLDEKHSKASYALTEKITNTGGIGFDIDFLIFKFGLKRSRSNVGDNSVTFDPLNVNVKNRAACSRRADALQLLDLRDCLKRDSEVYDHSKIKCGSTINIKTDTSGGAKVPIYVVTLGPSGDWATEYSRVVQVIAPPAAAGAQREPQ